MSVTLKELADSLGLSPTAVSLVLNNRPNRISQEKREIILQRAKELNYIPNQFAVGLVKKESKTLGVIIPDINNLFFSDIVSGIDKIAREHDFNIIISSSKDCYKNDLDIIRMLTARGVDAIIGSIASDAGEDAFKQYKALFHEFGKPVILVDRQIPSLSISSIRCNVEKGTQLALQYLHELNHRRIAILSGPKNSSSERMKGVINAFKDFDSELSSSDIFDGDFTINSGYAAADQILEGNYSAVFCFNDLMAYGLYKRFNELKIRIPEDISVLGFDDIFFSDYLNLTTVRQPAFDMGMEASRRAFCEINNPNCRHRTIILEPSLQIRGSVLACRRTAAKKP